MGFLERTRNYEASRIFLSGYYFVCTENWNALE